jgi:O-antigen/teichoic acid export membrane protein
MKLLKYGFGKLEVFRDTVYFSLAGVFSALTPLALVPLLTRTLSINEYAYYVLITSAISLIIPLMGFGSVNAVVVRYFHLNESNLRTYLSSVVRILVSSAVFFVLLTIVFRNALTALFEPGLLLLIFSIGVAFLSALALLFASLYIASADSYGYFRIYFTFGVVLFVSTTFFCWGLGLGLLGACLGLALGYIGFVISSYRESKLTRLDRSWSVANMRDALKFGLPLLIHSLGVALISLGDRFAVSKWVGSEAVAGYGVTAQLALVVGYFFHAVNKAVQPRIFSLLKAGGTSDQKVAISFVYSYCLSVVIVAALYALFLPLLVLWLAGDSYQMEVEVYGFVMLGSAFNSMYLGFVNFIFFSSKTFKLSLITTACATSYIGFLFWFAPRYGVSGIAFSYALTNGLMLMLTITLASYCTNVRWLDSKLFSFSRLKSLFQ